MKTVVTPNCQKLLRRTYPVMVAQRHIDEMESRRSAKSSVASGIETLLKTRNMTQHLVFLEEEWFSLL
jgi:hypothetical protein